MGAECERSHSQWPINGGVKSSVLTVTRFVPLSIGDQRITVLRAKNAESLLK